MAWVRGEAAAKDNSVVYGIGRLHAFYVRNRIFPDADGLVKNIACIAHLAMMVVRGGHDVLASMQSAYRVHKAWLD